MEPAAASDAELIAATRAGSDEAFSLLYRRHLGAARAAAHTLIRSRTAAEDLVAEGFTRILAALRRGAGPEVAFRPYLLTCIKNAAYDRHRRDRRVELAPDVGETQADPTLVDPALLTEERHMIARAFTSLPDRWQAVLWHTEVEGMSAAAVAPILGLSPNSVSALHYRAREGLRQAFLQAHIGAATPVTCRASRNRLGRYVRNGLTPTEEAVVDRHLETCEGCRALLDELTNVDTSLRSVMVPLVVGGPAGAYLAGLSAGGLGAVGLGVGGLFGLPALKIGFIAASVLAVAAGVALTAYPDRPDRPTATTMVVARDSAREEGDPGTGGAGRGIVVGGTRRHGRPG